MSPEVERSTVPGWVKRVLWSQILIILVAVLVYGFVWLRIVTTVRNLQAQKQHLMGEIESKRTELASLKNQRDAFSKDVTQLTAGINDLPDTSKQVQELKGQARQAWTKYVPKEAWCYQERDQPDLNRFSVYCHWSEDRCNKAKQGSRKGATACVLVPNLDTANWTPSPKGLYDSWYQLDRDKPLPPPFPQFNAEHSNVSQR